MNFPKFTLKGKETKLVICRNCVSKVTVESSVASNVTSCTRTAIINELSCVLRAVLFDCVDFRLLKIKTRNCHFLCKTKSWKMEDYIIFKQDSKTVQQNPKSLLIRLERCDTVIQCPMELMCKECYSNCSTSENLMCNNLNKSQNQREINECEHITEQNLVMRGKNNLPSYRLRKQIIPQDSMKSNMPVKRFLRSTSKRKRKNYLTGVSKHCSQSHVMSECISRRKLSLEIKRLRNLSTILHHTKKV